MRYRLLSLGETGLVEDGGASVDFPMGKPFGILAYLALASDPVSRDELAAVFWNDGDRSRARHSLRQALSFIRSRLGEDVFASDDPVALEPTVLETDVDVLRQALREGDMDRVLEVYGGPFLQTFQLTSSSAWDHWVEIQRRILEERVAAALRDEAARSESPGRAADLLRRVVEIEPHRVAHRSALVDRLLEQGDIEAATGAVAEARQADLDDPDVLDELEARVRSVREDRRARSEDRAEPHPEFVGRTAELAALAATWREVARGHRGIAILNGPTGIGKTRLAEELATLVSATGRAVHVKASTMERRLDWSVTAELARSLYRLPGAAGVGAGAMSVLRSLVPSLGGSGDSSPTVAPRPVAISDALVDLVSAVAYEAPLLIVLDDMQWVDRASLALLLRMVRQIRDEPVMVVLTFRSEELGSREYDAIQALVREESASVSRLHTLGEAEVQEMLANDLAEPPERIERLAARLHDVTRGHPLFLVELLRSLRDDGVLVRDEDGWRFGEPGPVQLELPASVRLVIDKRLEQLSDPARQVGTELASLPPSAGLERVRARAGLSDADFTRGLNELIDRAVVSWDPNGRLVFTHDQLREAMADDQRRSTHWRLAAAAVAVVVIGALTALAFGTPDASDRWGGGTIIVPDGDTLLAVDPTPAPDKWEAHRSSIWRPAVDGVAYRLEPRRLADGRVVWHGSVPGTVEAPEGVIFWGPGDRHTRHWPGDDNIQDVSPDGQRIPWVTQRYGGGGYAKELRLAELEDDTGTVVAGPASFFESVWSPDGTRLAVRASMEQDSVLVLTPAGQRLHGWAYYLADLEGWCGLDRVLAVVRSSPTAERSRLLLDLESGTETVLDQGALPGGRCSPDGTGYVARTLDGGVIRWMVTEIATGNRYPLPQSFNTGFKVFWLRDSVPPVPVALESKRDTLCMTRGGTHGLRARVRLSNGDDRPGTVRWRSADPAIASILGDTTVAANRAGGTTIVGEYAGWWADTVVVRVAEGDGESLIMTDDFRSLDLGAWYMIGRPVPRLGRADGRPVLELRGDGRYTDGLISRTARPAPTGFTAELEIRMPLTSREYQGFALHVGNYQPPESPESWDHLSAWSHGDAIIMSLPAFELDKWDPRLVALRSISGLEAIARLSGASNAAEWMHVAVQVQADGMATLWLDRHEAARFRMPTEFLEKPLRLAIIGRTHETHGYVRNFTWWAEPRYR